jgi:F-type H+-transporting ATPase subunit alpha
MVRGFSELRANELILFPGGLTGIAASLSLHEVGVILLGPASRLIEGAEARRTKRVVDAPVGESLLGRVIDPLGRPLDDRSAPSSERRLPVDQPAPPIVHRAPVETPLQTGIKAIDAAIPIGRGQRELIIGDRQSGKTSIAVDAILNQKDTGVVSIYCAIGQRASAVARVIQLLKAHDALQRCIVVVAGGEDAPGLQYIAPYAATTMAEAFMRRGQDVLIVYDDLTRHARAYRELSLLLRHPPGREAYPGDIFYIHARLLERSTHLRPEHGGGSLTALPIIETQARNMAAYIPTNLISITDGQVYLSPILFEKGQMPAIDIGKSVSRVGGKAQLPAYRSVAADLRLAYAQFEELETFARFGTRLDDDTRSRLERGRRVREILKQPEHAGRRVADQIAALLAATSGILDEIAIEDIAKAERVVLDCMTGLDDLAKSFETGAALDADDRQRMILAFRAALSSAGLIKASD